MQNEISDLQKDLSNFTYTKDKSKNKEELVTYYNGLADFRSSHPEVLLEKGVLKISSKFSGEHPCQSVISVKLQSNCFQLYFTLTRLGFLKVVFSEEGQFDLFHFSYFKRN